ncbi:hypothetical protein CHUAL_004677 [Chamberlinius hualienensis]
MDVLSEKLLIILKESGQFNTLKIAQQLNEDHQKIVGCVKSIQALGDVIKCEQISQKVWELSEEGAEVVKNGSHEALVFNAVPVNGIFQAELMKTVPNAKIGFSKAIAAGWIAIDKTSKDGPKIIRKVDSIDDEVRKNLLLLKDNCQNSLADSIKQEYKKRKLLQELLIKSFDVTKGSDFSVSLSKLETDLTPEMIANGSWRDQKFKAYNFDAMGVSPVRGHLHPLMRVRAQFRQIFLEMGFTEMPTNNFVESSFWNFDALFQPQQHPARDAHDTFFISNPQFATQFPSNYLKRVHKVHQEGDYGSQGYKYEWKLEEAKKNLLRTHTTAVSARMLYQLAQQEEFKPVKYFSIDRVFRNETLDATHLAEFFQIEGVVADYGLTLGDLIGVIYEFFNKLGITKLRFKPAYNPYTEPSMEIFSYHEGLQKWVEVGNSGLFRPEMLLPMGLPPTVRVIAWGLSLERPTMIKFGINNIRDLVGHKVNLQMVYDAPICRLDKNKDESSFIDRLLVALRGRQDKILNQLQSLKDMVEKFTKEIKGTSISYKQDTNFINTDCDIVIYGSAKIFPASVIVLLFEIGHQRGLQLNCHIHSTVRTNPHLYTQMIQNYHSSSTVNCGQRNPLQVTFILHELKEESWLLIKPNQRVHIVGEDNISRYLARHLSPPYDADPVVGTLIDQWIDQITRTRTTNDASSLLKQVSSTLDRSKYLVGNKYSLADMILWSLIIVEKPKYLTPTVTNWLKALHSECKLLKLFNIKC